MTFSSTVINIKAKGQIQAAEQLLSGLFNSRSFSPLQTESQSKSAALLPPLASKWDKYELFEFLFWRERTYEGPCNVP